MIAYKSDPAGASLQREWLLANTRHMAAKVPSKDYASRRKTPLFQLMVKNHTLPNVITVRVSSPSERIIALGNHKSSSGLHGARNYSRTVSSLSVTSKPGKVTQASRVIYARAALPLLWVGQGPELPLGKSTPTPPLRSQDICSYESLAFPEPLTNPCPEGASGYGKGL